MSYDGIQSETIIKCSFDDGSKRVSNYNQGKHNTINKCSTAKTSSWNENYDWYQYNEPEESPILWM